MVDHSVSTITTSAANGQAPVALQLSGASLQLLLRTIERSEEVMLVLQTFLDGVRAREAGAVPGYQLEISARFVPQVEKSES